MGATFDAIAIFVFCGVLAAAPYLPRSLILPRTRSIVFIGSAAGIVSILALFASLGCVSIAGKKLKSRRILLQGILSFIVVLNLLPVPLSLLVTRYDGVFVRNPNLAVAVALCVPVMGIAWFLARRLPVRSPSDPGSLNFLATNAICASVAGLVWTIPLRTAWPPIWLPGTIGHGDLMGISVQISCATLSFGLALKRLVLYFRESGRSCIDFLHVARRGDSK